MLSFHTSLCYYHSSMHPGKPTFTRRDAWGTPFENMPEAQLVQFDHVKTLKKSSNFPANQLTAVGGICIILFHISRSGRWFKSYIWVISRTQFSTDECKQHFLKTWFLWNILIIIVVYHQNSEDTLNLVHMTCWPRPKCSEFTTFLRVLTLASAAMFLTSEVIS